MKSPLTEVRRSAERAIVKLEAERRAIDAQLEVLVRMLTSIDAPAPKKRRATTKKQRRARRSKRGRSLTAETKGDIRKLRQGGMSYPHIAANLGVSLSSAHRYGRAA